MSLETADAKTEVDEESGPIPPFEHIDAIAHVRHMGAPDRIYRTLRKAVFDLAKAQPVGVAATVLSSQAKRIEDLESQLDSALNAPCTICAGEPEKMPRPCLCGGVGTYEAEVREMRARLLALEIRIIDGDLEAARAVVEGRQR